MALRSTFACAFLVLSACDGCKHVPEPTAPAPQAAPQPSVAPEATTPRMQPAVLAQHPHDPAAFTQGLVFANGTLLEGTGQYGESSLRRVEPVTGRVLKKIDAPAKVFGEGIARLNGEVFELTWQDHVCYVYDEATFAKKRELSYEGEGWGLTTDPTGAFVMSDGTPVIRFRDPTTFLETRHITVHDGSETVAMLNELEYVHGQILANIWQTNLIARIDPSTGKVVGYLDMSTLPEPPHPNDPDAVLNGIAFDEGSGHLFITGKRWHTMFEIPAP